MAALARFVKRDHTPLSALTQAYLVGHFHQLSKFMIDKRLVRKLKMMNMIARAKFFDLEELGAIYPFLQPQMAHNARTFYSVHAGESDLGEQRDTCFDRMKLDLAELLPLIDEKPEKLNSPFRFALKEVFDRAIPARMPEVPLDQVRSAFWACPHDGISMPRDRSVVVTASGRRLLGRGVPARTRSGK